MDQHTIETYNTSFECCIAKPGFLPRFYALFLGSSPDVRDRFKHTDMKRQMRILRKSLYVLTMASIGTREAHREIVRLGESHGRHGMNIPPHLYDLWLDCLLQAVRETDGGWNRDVEKSWRRMLGPHIEALKSYSDAG